MFSENEFRFEGRRLSVVSDGTVSLIYRPLPEEFREAGAARWSWRVEESVPATDLTQKGVDDRNLSIYFLFLTEAEAASLGEADVRDLLESEAVRLLRATADNVPYNAAQERIRIDIYLKENMPEQLR